MIFNSGNVESSNRTLKLARIVSATGVPPGSNANDLESWSSDRSFVMSFARGLSVIHAFGNQRRPLTVADISRKTKIPRAAVNRLLHTLTELGYVRKLDFEYVLTPKMLLMAHDFLSSDTLAVKAQPIVNRLSKELSTFCALSVRDDDDAMLVCVSNLRTKQDMQTQQANIGMRAPLYCGASGCLFLSDFDKPELDAYFNRVLLRPLTHGTPTTLDDLRELVRQAGEQRYALVDRTFTPEHRCAAVPVIDKNGNMVAALIVVMELEQCTMNSLIHTVLPQLSAAARELSAQLK